MSHQNQIKKQSKNSLLNFNQIVLVALLACLPCLLFCQKEGKVEKTIPFPNGITELRIKSPINVILTTDTSSLVSVFGSKKAVRGIRIKEKNGKLTLRKAFFSPLKSSPFIVVSAPALRKLNVVENSTVESSGLLSLSSLEVVVNADATVRLRIDGDSVTTTLKGNGSVHIEGYYQQSEVRKDPFGWCQVQYHRVSTAFVSDPH